MDKKLSVAQRSTDKTGWSKSSQFSSTDIKDIKADNAAGNDKSLNAIPSPFARIHLFQAAFDLVGKDESNNTNYSGDTYKKIVSDCFDVFELIYNWNNHLRDNKKLSIIKWNKETEIKKLKMGSSGNRLLGETLEVFFNEEAFGKMNDVLIIMLDRIAIAGSSPFTGFFTTPNNLNDLNLYNPISRRNYFSRIIAYKDRKPEIKKFIYDFFSSPLSEITHHTQSVRDYLHSYRLKLDDSVSLLLEPLKSPNNELFGIKLSSTCIKTETDYFEKYLIKVNYRLNSECFHVPKNNNADRKHDYLLPFTPVFYEDFNSDEIESIVTINEADKKTVTVVIQKGRFKFSKSYQVNQIQEEDGQIVDLYQTFGVKINLGIFPFLKVVEKGQSVNGQLDALMPYNSFYKIMLVSEDSNYQFSNKDFRLSFGIDKGMEPLTAPSDNNYICQVEHRTILERDKCQVGSSYYSVKGRNGENMCFEYIQLELPPFFKEGIRCTVVPKWRERLLGTRQLDYSIDFGTTTTFIAYTDDPNRESEPQAISFAINQERGENDYTVAMLNLPSSKTPQSTHIACYENFKVFQESIELQKQELIPSLINNETYSVPFRTVVYQKNNIEEGKKNLFSNTNIAFNYQRGDNFLTGFNQKYYSNLKWNIKTQSDKENVEVFVEEILRMLLLKTLLQEGDPHKTQLTWFSPLSFTPADQKVYKDLWENKFKLIFQTSSDKIGNISESEAPYYYYNKKAVIKDRSAVLTMDIGGGTTDLMYVRDKPILCTSVHFGANVLWSNGFNELIRTAKDNGIYNSIKNTIESRLKSSTLKSLNDKLTGDKSEYSSDEIINFWILNDDQSMVIKELDNENFRLSYLLHFSALVFHAYEIIKAKGQPAPTCIVFSGNGSKYLDLIQTDLYIGKICNYFGKVVFGQVQKEVQIILPKKNRKEATCYGGLYNDFKATPQYETVTLLGAEESGKTYKIYSDIFTQKDAILTSLETSFIQFIEYFFLMNEVKELNFRTTFKIDTDLAAIKTFLLSHVAENINLGMAGLKKSIRLEDPIIDSLFFMPLIGLLYNLNKLSGSELNGYKKITNLFAICVDDNGGFSSDSFLSDRRSDSIFLIEITQDDPDTGLISVISEPSVYKRAVGALSTYLQPVCDWLIYPSDTDREIKIIEKGLVIRNGSTWEVKCKIKIEFK